MIGALSATAAVSRTVVSTPSPGRSPIPTFVSPLKPEAAVARVPTPTNRGERAEAPPRRSRLGWVGDSIGYIYVYTRGKLDAGEHRRRLSEERDGAEAMLGGAVRELGSTILREGIQHAEFTAFSDAIRRAEVRRETAAGDIVASEQQKEAEENRLAAQEAGAEAEWKVCDAAARDADDVLRTATTDHERASTRLGRVRDDRARLAREAEAAAANPDGRARAARLRHEGQGLATEQRTLEEQVKRLERQLRDLREKSASLRAEAARARSKLDQAVTKRRQAGSDIAASITGHVRDRAEAEHAVTDLTEQLGRVAAESSARLAASPLLSAYQRIDRLKATIAERTNQIAALDQAAGHYDLRKLLTGVGLLTSMLLATAAVLWVALR